MPYLVILASSGIFAVVSNKATKKAITILCAVIGIGSLVLFTILSYLGLQFYFTQYQKADWRQATHFISSSCSESLRLYFTQNNEASALYYDPNVRSQEKDWMDKMFDSDLPQKERISFLSSGYKQVCLVNLITNPQRLNPVEAAIEEIYPFKAINKFYGLSIEVFTR